MCRPKKYARECMALLSSDERARWQALRFDGIAANTWRRAPLLRIALSHYHPLSPEAWRFSVNAYGKPAVELDSLRFNLSNSPGLVVCLIAHGAEVGVDVEPCGRSEEIAKLAPGGVFAAGTRTACRAWAALRS